MRYLAAVAPLAATVCLGTLSCCPARVETTQYLGVFDPYEQVAQELYRIKITGDSGLFSEVKYGSGWVPAQVADLLALDVRPGSESAHAWQMSNDVPPGAPTVGARRRFFEIGPLGVSTEPQDGRFVVVMSDNPDEFFRRVALLTRYGRQESAQKDETASALRAIATERAATLAELHALLGSVGEEESQP